MIVKDLEMDEKRYESLPVIKSRPRDKYFISYEKHARFIRNSL